MIKTTVTTYRPQRNGGVSAVNPFPGDVPAVGDTVSVWARTRWAYGPPVSDHFIDDAEYAYDGRMSARSANGVTTRWEGYGRATVVSVDGDTYTVSLEE